MANRSGTSLNLQSEERSEPARGGGKGLVVLILLLMACIAGLGFLAYRMLLRTVAAERQLAVLSGKTDEATAVARQAMEKVVAAEAAARAAAEGRQLAEVQAAGARGEADAALQAGSTARQEASSARETAARAQAGADSIRKKAQAERNRLEAALGGDDDVSGRPRRNQRAADPIPATVEGLRALMLAVVTVADGAPQIK